MARITMITTEVMAPIYLKDIDKKQRQITFPPGQDRYLHPIDTVALDALLDDLGSATTAAAMIAATVTANDLSLATITTASGVALTAPQAQSVQDLLSYKLIETGDFLLSFDRGQIKGLIDLGFVKVFPDNAAGLYA